ncbi:hypothetical protein [Candidatus Raskinella chloraquaticus]|uniref:hypothetical protein n=1 Tax=Candidatus Raskinella chloraquaticus TaxID=1951219 RepID=UPI00367109E4
MLKTIEECAIPVIEKDLRADLGANEGKDNRCRYPGDPASRAAPKSDNQFSEYRDLLAVLRRGGGRSNMIHSSPRLFGQPFHNP